MGNYNRLFSVIIKLVCLKVFNIIILMASGIFSFFSKVTTKSRFYPKISITAPTLYTISVMRPFDRYTQGFFFQKALFYSEGSE